MRKFTMRDQSVREGDKLNVARENNDLSLQDALDITDFSNEEANQLADLKVGDTMYLDGGDIYIGRTE